MTAMMAAAAQADLIQFVTTVIPRRNAKPRQPLGHRGCMNFGRVALGYPKS